MKFERIIAVDNETGVCQCDPLWVRNSAIESVRTVFVRQCKDNEVLTSTLEHATSPLCRKLKMVEATQLLLADGRNCWTVKGNAELIADQLGFT